MQGYNNPRKRKFAWDVAMEAKRRKTGGPAYKPVYRQSGGNTRGFVPRSFGTPLAVTERKYFDATRANLAFPDWSATAAGGELDPAANSLFNPVQGDDFNNRQGRKVTLLALKIRGTINVVLDNNQLAAVTTPSIRLLLVQDTQTNAAQLNSEDVVLTNANGFQNPAFFGRFRVLKDKFFLLPQAETTGINDNRNQNGYQKAFKMSIKFKKPVVIHYNSTNGGTVADVIDNSFHIIGGTTDVTMAPGIAYTVRGTFIDR